MATKAQVAKAVDTHLAAARATGKERHKRGELAVAVGYEPRKKRLRIELASGSAVVVPAAQVEGLADATPAVLKTVKLTGKGYGLHWPKLDLDVSVPDLVAGCFGTEAWMRVLARHAGKVTSPTKAVASRENGKKGGRPPKVPWTKRRVHSNEKTPNQ